MAKYDLFFDQPVLNAAGSLGFAPDRRGLVDLDSLGAFITNPISRQPRTPAQGDRYGSFSGGFLLHTGLPNPGFKAVLRRHAARWERAELPVIVHLLAQEPGECYEMVQQLERLDGIMGIELGLPPGADVLAAKEFVQAAAGELPVIARIALDEALTLAFAVMQAGAAAISLGPPRGVLPGSHGRLFWGRLYGPALFPQTLAATAALSRDGLPVIAAGGVYSRANLELLLAAGALAVQLDAVLWRGEWNSTETAV